MTTTAAAGTRLSFDAILENWAEGMDYSAVAVPAKITEALGTKAAVAVTATVNGSKPFAASLFPVGGGKHYMRIRSAVRRSVQADVGDRMQVQIELRDREAVEVPADLSRALRSAGATKAFRSLPPGKRGFMIRRIEEAVRPETRERRIIETVEAAREKGDA